MTNISRRSFLKVITATTGAMVFDPGQFFTPVGAKLIEPVVSVTSVNPLIVNSFTSQDFMLLVEDFSERCIRTIATAMAENVDKELIESEVHNAK